LKHVNTLDMVMSY